LADPVPEVVEPGGAAGIDGAELGLLVDGTVF
jgi:hypothetical protein